MIHGCEKLSDKKKKFICLWVKRAFTKEIICVSCNFNEGYNRFKKDAILRLQLFLMCQK